MITSYNYKGYSPYGAGEQYIIDNQISSEFDSFNGNATEEAIKNGAIFKIVNDECAVLDFGHISVEFIKR